MYLENHIYAPEPLDNHKNGFLCIIWQFRAGKGKARFFTRFMFANGVQWVKKWIQKGGGGLELGLSR